MSNESYREKLDSIFKEFCRQHDETNHFMRSTEVCYRFVRMHTESLDKAVPVSSLFTGRWKRRDSLKQYRGRFEETGRRSRANIQDLEKDISEDWDVIWEAVIVREASAFEKFIRDWTLTAAQSQIQASHLSSERSNLLNDLVNGLIADPRRSIPLTVLSRYFPAIDTLLKSTTHKRTLHPILAAPTLGISCFNAAQMWREVRHLILHHGRIVHDDFAKHWSETWKNLAKEAKQCGHRIVIRPAVVGERLPLVLRHTVFCLTTCYQAVVIFHIAAGGTES